MNEMINLFDEEGNLLPLELLQEQLFDIYNNMSKKRFKKNTILNEMVNPENLINSEEVIDTTSFLSRSLHLCSQITHEHAVAFSDLIKFWNEIDTIDEIPIEEREPIKIYIDCPGGDLGAALSIIDSIMLSQTPVWTITIGSGNSGGFFIGIVGHKKIGYPHSSYLFHEGSCVNEGDAHKFLQSAAFYQKQLSMLKQIVLDNTKITSSEYDSYKKDDLWLTADEALKFGVIDEIATKII